MSALRFLSVIFVLLTSIVQANIKYEVKSLEIYFEEQVPEYRNHSYPSFNIFLINNNGVVAGQYQFEIDRESGRYSQGFVLDVNQGKLVLITDPIPCKWDHGCKDKDCNCCVDCDEDERYVISLNDKGNVLLQLAGRPYIWSPDKGLLPINIAIKDSEVLSALAMNNLDQVILRVGPASIYPPILTSFLNKNRFVLWDENNGSAPLSLKTLISKKYKFHPMSIDDEGQILCLIMDTQSKSDLPETGFCIYQKGKLLQYYMPKLNSTEMYFPESWNKHGDLIVKNTKNRMTDKYSLWSSKKKKTNFNKVEWLRDDENVIGYPIAINDSGQLLGYIKVFTYQSEISEYEYDRKILAIWNPQKGWEGLEKLINVDPNKDWHFDKLIAFNNNGQILAKGYSDKITPLDNNEFILVERERGNTFLLSPLINAAEIP